MKKIEYPFTIRRLSKVEGGGWLVEFPDLPGCLADGETIGEAVENGADALRSWLVTAKEFKDPVPAPSTGLSGKWVQHRRGPGTPSYRVTGYSDAIRPPFRLRLPGSLSEYSWCRMLIGIEV